MKVLVTGTAGFIGFHVATRLLQRGDSVLGLDNVNDYYDVRLKHARLERLRDFDEFQEARFDLQDTGKVQQAFAAFSPQRVIHLAAQAGVRYSIENPRAYIDSNIVGTLNILEGCRHSEIEHLVYASTSSIYGANTQMPFSVQQNVDHPLSMYAATKKSNELMAHTYSHLFKLPTTGLRFFTVYGPWGRPDMALFLFTQKILAGETIPIFNHGRHQRDFTYIDDIVTGVVAVLDQIAKPNPLWSGDDPDPATSLAPYRIYNIGNRRPIELMRYIEILEHCLGRKAKKEYLPLQPGDVPATHADTATLEKAVGYTPATPIETGVKRFVRWYLDYHNIRSLD